MSDTAASEVGPARAARPLRIAMSSYYLPSESKIGAGYVAHRFAQQMVQRGHEVTMFSPCRRPDDATYEHVHVPLDGRLRTFRWPLRIRELDLSGFDVFHAHGDDHLRIGVPTPAHVRTMHGSCLSEAVHIHGAVERLRMVLLGLTEVAATGVADRTVLISENTRRWFPWVRRVIGNGVDLEQFAPGAKTSDPTILFVGTYEQRKRGRLLADVFTEEVRPTMPEARLLMVCSDAPERPGVEVLGRLTDAELATRYRSAWAFCLPSTYEGFGVPYIEAMASGTPVVATPNPGAVEVLAGGLFGDVVPDDELGAALLALLGDDELRRRRGDDGLGRAADYSWDRICGQYEHEYAMLLDRRDDRRHGRRLRPGRRRSPAVDGAGPEPLPRPAVAAGSPRRPIDIVVVGAQKASSTTLALVIGEHPDVDMASGEFHGFLDQHHSAEEVARLDDLFTDATAPHRGFKCASYLAEPSVVPRLHEELAEPHIVAGLRNPIDRAVSAWYWLVQTGLLPVVSADEGITTFLDGDAVGERWRHARDVLEWGLYARHLDVYRRWFPTDKLHVVTDVELARDPAGTIRWLYERLGLDPSFVPTAHGARHNAGIYSIQRLRWLNLRQRLVWREQEDGSWRRGRPEGSIAWVANAGVVGIDRVVLARLLENRPPALRAETRARLVDYYRDDVEALGSSLGLDLTTWLR